MDLSVIIVNHNTLPLTRRCIDSLYALTQKRLFEVIVVDNASTDGSQRELSHDERIIFLPLKQNEGYGRANNRALRIALGQYILFLNPDTRLLNNAAEQMVALLEQRRDVVACGANLYNEKLQPMLSFRPFLPSLFSEVDSLLCGLPQRLRWGRNRYFNHSTTERRVSYITGADMMVRRIALDKVGGFNEEFFLYYEDTDLCRRLATQGTLLSLPSAHIQHTEGGSFIHSRRQTRRILLSEQGRECYFRLNHSRLHHNAANAVYRCSLYLRSMAYAVRGKRKALREVLLRLRTLERLQQRELR